MTIILVNRHEALKVEEEEKVNWVMGILEAMGVPTEDWSKEPTMENLRRIRSFLKKLEVDIIDDSDMGIEIYFKNDLIAEWRRPNYVLRENLQERDVKYRYYLEMHLKCKSVFDKNIKG